jgi:2-oxoglutarate ferredoxin oxidoreductase subunit beta
LIGVLKRAKEHHGASFVEIFQNCIVFNDGAFSEFTDRALAADRQVHVEHGQPLLFGKDKEKGLRLKPGSLQLEVVTVGADGLSADDLLVHDETDRNLASLLVAMEPPDLPVALGVIYCNPATAYEDQVQSRLDAACCGDLYELVRSGRTWRV